MLPEVMSILVFPSFHWLGVFDFVIGWLNGCLVWMKYQYLNLEPMVILGRDYLTLIIFFEVCFERYWHRLALIWPSIMVVEVICFFFQNTSQCLGPQNGLHAMQLLISRQPVSCTVLCHTSTKIYWRMVLFLVYIVIPSLKLTAKAPENG